MPTKQIVETSRHLSPAERAHLLCQAWDSVAELRARLGRMCVGTEDGLRVLSPPFPSHQVTS